MVSCNIEVDCDGRKLLQSDVCRIPEEEIIDRVDIIDIRRFKLAHLAGMVIVISATIFTYIIFFMYSFYDPTIMENMECLYNACMVSIFQALLLYCIIWYMNNTEIIHSDYIKYISITYTISAFLYGCL